MLNFDGYEPEDGFEELGHFHFRFVPHRRTQVNQRCSVVSTETMNNRRTYCGFEFRISNVYIRNFCI